METTALPAVTTDYQPFIDRFIDDQDVQDNSKDTYRRCLKQFFLFCNESLVTNITARTVLDFKKKQKIDGKSSYTINLYLQLVKKFFSWAETFKIHNDIAKNIKRVKVPKGFAKEALTKEQAQKLVLNIENARTRAMVLLMITTGLRCIEVSRADVGDIRNIGEDTILMIQGKGHAEKDDYVKIPQDVLAEVHAYLVPRNAKPVDALFSSESRNNAGGRMNPGSISHIIKKALRDIGINDSRITAHSTRHTAITFSLLAGATIQEAQDLARHSSVLMTMKYAHNINKMKSKTSEQVMAYLKAVA